MNVIVCVDEDGTTWAREQEVVQAYVEITGFEHVGAPGTCLYNHCTLPWQTTRSHAPDGVYQVSRDLAEALRECSLGVYAGDRDERFYHVFFRVKVPRLQSGELRVVVLGSGGGLGG